MRTGANKNEGFSLIELLIVIAIILIIAAIAIPNLLRSRMAANEASAASGIRTITSAEIGYFTAFPSVGYAAQIQDLGYTNPCVPTPAHACLLDNNLSKAIPGSAGHSGYVFLATGISGGTPVNADFVAGSTPISSGRTGGRDFCSVTDGVLRSQPSVGGGPPVTLAGCRAFLIAQ